MKTYTVKAYSGTFRIKDQLKAHGFIWKPEDGGAWVKYHVGEIMLADLRAKEYGSWSGVVFAVREECE